MGQERKAEGGQIGQKKKRHGRGEQENNIVTHPTATTKTNAPLQQLIASLQIQPSQLTQLMQEQGPEPVQTGSPRGKYVTLQVISWNGRPSGKHSTQPSTLQI